MTLFFTPNTHNNECIDKKKIKGEQTIENE